MDQAAPIASQAWYIIEDQSVPFGTQAWFIIFAVMLFARGMDLLSTRVATPRMVLEGNPIAKKMGWAWGSLFNLAISIVFAFWPVPAIVVSTCSLLVAARNFEHAWLMRTMGEENYRDWFVARLRETRLSLYLACLFGQTLLTALVGAAVIYFGQYSEVLVAIGTGILGYTGAVILFTSLALWRMRRNRRKGL